MDSTESVSNSSSSASRRAFLGAIASGFVGACVSRPAPVEYAAPVPGLAELLADQASIYPLMLGEDVYKLLYQATLGPSAFFIGTESNCLRGLLAEIQQMKPATHDGEREIEVLCKERGLVRVNLRPYLKRGGKAEELARAICLTGRDYRGSIAELKASLAAAEELLPDLRIGGEPKDYRKVVRRMERGNYRPGVHSEPYALAYRPAYRIVLADFISDPLYGGRRNVYD
jgi:hypothetical protein